MLRRREFGRIRSALAASSHFQSLDGPDLDRLAQLGRLQRLRHAERAARDGAYEDRFCVILSGAVRVSSQAPGAKEYVYAVLGAGSYFGLATAVRRATFTADARAFGATDLAVFPGPSLVELLDERPRLWKHVCALLSRRLRLALLALRDNSVAPLPERIARRLLGHALGTDLRGLKQVEVRMTQADLALMLGASRSRINASLKNLERAGLVQAGYRGITNLDLPGLRRLAGPGIHAY
jgi:CRP-like cAMP-binding protein